MLWPTRGYIRSNKSSPLPHTCAVPLDFVSSLVAYVPEAVVAFLRDLAFHLRWHLRDLRPKQTNERLVLGLNRLLPIASYLDQGPRPQTSSVDTWDKLLSEREPPQDIFCENCDRSLLPLLSFDGPLQCAFPCCRSDLDKLRMEPRVVELGKDNRPSG